MRYASLGSISHGTLRTEDLLEAFATELEYHVQRNADEWCSDDGRKERDRLLALVHEARETDPEGDDACELVNVELPDALQAFAPPYCTFGAHEGDGSDFGFWFAGQECLDENDVVRVADPSEVEQHLGEKCYYVNDHGNLTIYGADGKPCLELV